MISAQIEVESANYDEFEDRANKQTIFGVLSQENIDQIRATIKEIDNIFKRIDERDRTEKDEQEYKLFVDEKLDKKIKSLNKENQENTQKLNEFKSKYELSLNEIKKSKMILQEMTERENILILTKNKIEKQKQEIFDQQQRINNIEYDKKKIFDEKQQFFEKMIKQIDQLKELQKS